MRNVPRKGRTTGCESATSAPVAGSALCLIVKTPSIDPSGTRCRTASDRSTVPLNVPLMTGRSGTWTELLPGALMTTSKVPLTGPIPVCVDTLSVPVAITVQLSILWTEVRSLDRAIARRVDDHVEGPADRADSSLCGHAVGSGRDHGAALDSLDGDQELGRAQRGSERRKA